MIEDGTNRVVASYRRGATEIDVDIVAVDPRKIEEYRKVVALRKSTGTTFENLPIDASDDKREARTINELRALEG